MTTTRAQRRAHARTSEDRKPPVVTIRSVTRGVPPPPGMPADDETKTSRSSTVVVRPRWWHHGPSVTIEYWPHNRSSPDDVPVITVPGLNPVDARRLLVTANVDFAAWRLALVAPRALAWHSSIGLIAEGTDPDEAVKAQLANLRGHVDAVAYKPDGRVPAFGGVYDRDELAQVADLMATAARAGIVNRELPLVADLVGWLGSHPHDRVARVGVLGFAPLPGASPVHDPAPSGTVRDAPPDQEDPMSDPTTSTEAHGEIHDAVVIDDIDAPVPDGAEAIEQVPTSDEFTGVLDDDDVADVAADGVLSDDDI